MNNSEFVLWVKSLTEQQVGGAGLKNPATVKAVCLILATYGDYATGTGVQPAWTTVAREACVSRTTAHKVRDWLVGNGVLVQTGIKKDNIRVYRYEKVDHLTWTTYNAEQEVRLSTQDGQPQESRLSIAEPRLSIPDSRLSIAEPRLSTLGGHNTTLDTTKDTKEDTREEKTEEPTSVADAPAVAIIPNSLLEEGGTMPNYKILFNRGEREDFERACRATSASNEQIAEAAKLLFGNEVQGYTWMEKCNNALTKVGVENTWEDEW